MATQNLPGTARRSTFLPFSPPSITQAEIDAVVDTLRSDWITTGPKTSQFEQAFAAYLGVESALGLNSCTAGLHLALATLGFASRPDLDKAIKAAEKGFATWRKVSAFERSGIMRKAADLVRGNEPLSPEPLPFYRHAAGEPATSGSAVERPLRVEAPFRA